jgi:predicted nuclease with TOPRIM domain
MNRYWHSQKATDRTIVCRGELQKEYPEMSDETPDIHARLDELGEKIKAHRAKLELHGLFAQEHKITEKELHDRWKELKSEIDAQAHDTDTAHKKADLLQRLFLKWVDMVDLDYKS